jgi:lysophospholipase L1-like esterase
MSLITFISALSGTTTGEGGTGGGFDLNNSRMVFDGNSLTAGQGSTGGLTYPAQLITLLGGLGITGIYSQNLGVGGQTTENMASDASTQVDTLINSSVSNILFAWEIGNDIYFNGDVSAAQTAFQNYCTARRSAGWDKIIVIGLTPRNQSTSFGDDITAFNTKLQSADTWLKANYGTFADAFVDIRADSRLSDYTNGAYYVDGIHYTNAGYGVVAELAKNQLLLL